MTGTKSSTEPVHIIGAGLAGSEAAWQVASAGVPRRAARDAPDRMTEAHRTDGLAELVCSNSFRSDDAANNAVGLLHAEMRRLGSLIMRAADANQVPAGGALAVDRDGFSAAVTKALHDHPLIEIRRAEIDGLPPADWRNVIVATGPLTSAPLADAIRELTDENALAFFDAIAPIVHKDSIDMSVAWFQSRYDKVGPGGTGADYINCPMTKEQYDAFVDALIAGEKTDFKEWETNTPYFDGCLPIEVMAERGRETLRHGPMKPVGLTNPHDPTVKAYAIVQLRQDNKLGTLYNMVGFQTKLKHGAQQRVFRTIPGLENAEFARLGGLHRNTFLNSPKLLDAQLRLRAQPRLRFAGQMTGCEGYVESASIGLIAGLYAAADARATVAGAAAGDHGAGIAARPHHRRPYRNHRRRPALVPADEHQFRAVSAARQSADQKARRHRGCAATKRPSPRSRRSAPARWPISIAGSPTTCALRRRREHLMSLPKDDAAVLSARWTEGVLLKRDVFSTVERGRFRSDAGEVDAVLRRLDQVPWWSYLPARHLFAPRAPRAGAGARPRCRAGTAVGRPAGAGARLHRRRRAASGQSRSATSPISAPPSRRCANCTAPASATTISPRSRTGCAAATAAPISPTSSSRPASRPAAGCSGSRPTRICGIC